jgi:hypothetical protein
MHYVHHISLSRYNRIEAEIAVEVFKVLKSLDGNFPQ